jgi:protein SSD1
LHPLRRSADLALLRSAAKLSYQEAQDVIEGKVLGSIPVTPEHDAAGIEHDIKVLQDLVKQLRTRRFQNGALASESLKLSFQLDENGMPIDCWQYERSDAHDVVEEVRVVDLLALSRNHAYVVY